MGITNIQNNIDSEIINYFRFDNPNIVDIVLKNAVIQDNKLEHKEQQDTILATHIRCLSNVNNKTLTKAERVNISSDKELLQCSLLTMNTGKTFPPHYHLPTKKTTVGTQEAWVIITGSVLAKLYLTNVLIRTITLHPGDNLISYQCGHTYDILEDKTLVYEFKTGPYLGFNQDKVRFEI